MALSYSCFSVMNRQDKAVVAQASGERLIWVLEPLAEVALSSSSWVKSRIEAEDRGTMRVGQKVMISSDLEEHLESGQLEACQCF